MSLVQLDRTPFTELVINTLRGAGWLAGDGQLPDGGGWQGNVNTAGARFVPYIVVSDIVASHSSGPIGDPQGDWQLPYLLECFAGSRQAAETLGARARVACRAMLSAHVLVGADPNQASYGFQQVRFDSLEQVDPIGQLQPPVWRSQNTVTLWIGKEA